MFSQDLPAFLTDTDDYKDIHRQAEAHLQDILHSELPNIKTLFDTVCDEHDLAEMQRHAHQWQQRFKTLVILGTGGSSLGAQTLCALKQFSFSHPSCRVLFMDNIDPVTFEALLQNITLAETGFLIVSKSGTTAETLCQFLTLMPLYTPSDRPHHLFVITEPKDSPLRTLALEQGLTLFNHPLDIGGRFSVFTNVGLLPAAVAGIDIQKIRQGAQRVLADPQRALEGATLAAAALEQGYTQTVLMPYCDQLLTFTFWFRQLWAESLGKQGKGSTPLNALGTVDQHSQLQLYLDGPRDKLFTVLVSEDLPASSPLHVPASCASIGYLHQKTMADLMIAEQRATIETLRHRGCPVRVIRLPSLQEEDMGALLMHFMLETMITARLLGVDAFDQPAVEEGKRLTRLYLNSELR